MLWYHSANMLSTTYLFFSLDKDIVIRYNRGVDANPQLMCGRCPASLEALRSYARSLCRECGAFPKFLQEGISLEYILYCDESGQNGPKYSDFFGGCLVSSKNLFEVTNALDAKKLELRLLGEVKWTKVTENYLSKYIELITLFFSFVKGGKIKVRIMFHSNKDQPSSTAVRTADDKYFKLYYQFIKHAFGFRYQNTCDPFFLRVYLDQLPDKKEKCAEFKRHLHNMQNTSDFSRASVIIRAEDIAEVNSHEHVLLQCLDIVLGAMYFRLNNLHKIVQYGTKKRGKRTIAKEKLYKHIHDQINDIFPHFNIGDNTGSWGDEYPYYYWTHPYRHWKFKPN